VQCSSSWVAEAEDAAWEIQQQQQQQQQQAVWLHLPCPLPGRVRGKTI
jgi:hypothetical protein